MNVNPVETGAVPHDRSAYENVGRCFIRKCYAEHTRTLVDIGGSGASLSYHAKPNVAAQGGENGNGRTIRGSVGGVQKSSPGL